MRYRPVSIRCIKCNAIQPGPAVPRHCYRCGGKCR